jgi:small subunit ribosomal protein S17
MTRTLKGIIISKKMKKTAVVKVDRLKKHPLYHKYYRMSKKFQAHDEREAYHNGEEVMIQETKPRSRHKRWEIVSLVKEAAPDRAVSGEDNDSDAVQE